jgi:type-F conjugative transfer system pilin assembly protein TrbC
MFINKQTMLLALAIGTIQLAPLTSSAQSLVASAFNKHWSANDFYYKLPKPELPSIAKLGKNAGKELKRFKTKVFLSLSMPADRLKNWIDEASHLNAPVSFAGLTKDSFTETVNRFKKLQQKLPALSRNHKIQIDPEGFKQFNINAVPAVVITDTANDTADVVYGDIGLREALDRFAQSHNISTEDMRELLNK